MFGASALYHRGTWSPPTASRLLQLDHTAIFLLIAGTYTPIALLAMDGTAHVVTLTAVWLRRDGRHRVRVDADPRAPGYVTTVYMFLGWICAFAFVPLYDSTGWWGVGLIAGRGLCYTIGAIVHAARKPDPWPETFGYHEIFHVFVILAALLHYCAIGASCSRWTDLRVGPRAAQPRVLGRRRRRLPGRARRDLAAAHVGGVADPRGGAGLLGDVGGARRPRVRLRRGAVVGRAHGRRRRASSGSTSRAASCATHARSATRPDATVPLVCASGEAVPLADASFDLVFCDHGAMSFCDPDRSVPEVARLLRPGGRLVFSHATPWPYLAWNFKRERVGRRLRRSYFGMRRFDDGGGDGTVDFQLPVRRVDPLLPAHGLVVDDLVELRTRSTRAPRSTTSTPAGLAAGRPSRSG